MRDSQRSWLSAFCLRWITQSKTMRHPGFQRNDVDYWWGWCGWPFQTRQINQATRVTCLRSTVISKSEIILNTAVSAKWPRRYAYCRPGISLSSFWYETNWRQTSFRWFLTLLLLLLNQCIMLLLHPHLPAALNKKHTVKSKIFDSKLSSYAPRRNNEILTLF